jgi:hypothetical protein
MGRGPIPDKPRNRPTVPEVAEALRAYYRLPDRGVGGAVHIVIDDGNITQGSADWCAEHAREWGEQWARDRYIDEDVRIAEMVAALTNTQRSRLARMNFYSF